MKRMLFVVEVELKNNLHQWNPDEPESTEPVTSEPTSATASSNIQGRWRRGRPIGQAISIQPNIKR